MHLQKILLLKTVINSSCARRKLYSITILIFLTVPKRKITAYKKTKTEGNTGPQFGDYT